MNTKLMTAAVACGALLLAGTASANLLANPGFEGTGPGTYGSPGWIAFGNTFTETNNGGDIVAYEGQGVLKMFGNFSGSFNVSGAFQEFATAPGEEWTMNVVSRHASGDPMVGAGAPDFNWAVMKLAFFDAGNNEIAGVDGTVLDGTFATDVWHSHAPIVATAPPGTVKVQALLLYLQPAFDGGAAQFDAATVTMSGVVSTESSSWGEIKASTSR